MTNPCDFRSVFAVVRLSVLSVVLLIVFTGCGSNGPSYPHARLAGSVSIDGKALPADAEGEIRFMPNASGQPASCPIVKGRYECPHVPIGPVTVIVRLTRLTGRQVIEEGAPGGAPYAERQNLVPEEHRSGIVITVAGDNASQDFNL